MFAPAFNVTGTVTTTQSSQLARLGTDSYWSVPLTLMWIVCGLPLPLPYRTASVAGPAGALRIGMTSVPSSAWTVATGGVSG
ncbi:hypothetical protein AB0383_34245 [Amycolatopsis sp. NPDC051373]|uniref:hypothetical protein n=1 Tax=Amycolatopsis sp. NPDC051373 TaxID=3155801 RepID=UPI00344D155B